MQDMTGRCRRPGWPTVLVAAAAVALAGCDGPSSPDAASLGKSTANSSGGAHSALRTPQASRPAREVIGHSADRRPIVADRLGAAGACAAVLVVGSIAGDEPGGISVVDALRATRAIAGVTFWLVPDMNPDGLARGTRVNADGVDLNRNFPFRWHAGVPHGNTYYPGPGPLSEPESRATALFIRGIRPALGIWLHQPYGLVDDSQGPLWAERLLADATGLPLERLPDYPGSAIGWEDQLVPHSAFDVELPGGTLSSAQIRRYVAAIRLVARELVRRHCRPRPLRTSSQP